MTAVQESGTRTADVTLAITCPTWCRITPAEHAEGIWDWDGHLLHYSKEVVVADTGRGPEVGSLDEPKPLDPVRLSLVSTTNHLGQELSSPTFWIDDARYSIEQLEALSYAIRDLVATYRAAGGVA